MRPFASIAALCLVFAVQPLAAQEIGDVPATIEAEEAHGSGTRFVPADAATVPQGIAVFGPFRVLDGGRAALVDVTDQRSPVAFAAMMRAYPGIGMLEMLECPGTEDDLANLRLGQMIRESGIATFVPAGGSVRSGGVELFLAGARRFADPGAEFAVHAWMDEDGREADDYALSAPENRKYLDYYRQMGMNEPEARAFYAMTNSAPHAEARWFDGKEMAQWVRLDRFEGWSGAGAP